MPVKYHSGVKKPKAEIEWTPEMIYEVENCMTDFFHFSQYVKVTHPDKGRVTFEPRWYQKELLTKILNSKYFVGLLARQVGKSVSVGVYALWYAMFNGEKTIGIVSNKETSAKDILKRIKKMYQDLPDWLKPGVQNWAETFVSFDNGTEILVSATSTDAFRGRTINLLICDEFAFVNKNMAEDFWASNEPTISASESGQIIIISTPNGLYNLFHRIYSGAERGENGFEYCYYDWSVIPGRDEKWKEQQIKKLGKQKFDQEHGIKFLGSINTVIESEVLESLFEQWIDPTLYELKDRLRVYETPKNGHTYIMGCDVAKGTGEHYSAIQVLKVTSLNPFKVKQVAVFEDNYTDVYEFSSIVHRTALYYNYAYVIVENNAEGSTIVSRLWWDFEYENLVNESSKRTGLGIRAKSNTKPKAVIAMKKLIENGDLQLLDYNTINQLSSFIDKGNNKFGGKDLDDDLISALYWACFITEFPDMLEEAPSIDVQEDEEGWGILVDVGDEFDEDFDWVNDVSLW